MEKESNKLVQRLLVCGERKCIIPSTPNDALPIHGGTGSDYKEE